MSPDHLNFIDELHRFLVKKFSLKEWELLAFKLGINWRDLKGETISQKARELIFYAANRGRLTELVTLVTLLEDRPNLKWPGHLKPGSTSITKKEDSPVKRDPYLDLTDLRELNLLKMRVDAALPTRVPINQSFDLAVAVRRPLSPVLSEEDLDQIKTGDIQVEWPEGKDSVSLKIQVSSQDCVVNGKDSYSFRIYKFGESPVFYFQLTPMRTGKISILVTVFQEDYWMGGIRARTTAFEQIAGGVLVETVSQTTTDLKKSVKLHKLLTERISLDELKTIAFEMGVDFENLGGDTKEGKARELLIFLGNRGRIDELEDYLRGIRPDLFDLFEMK